MFKLNPITGQMDIIRKISDNPESNTAEESASTMATKTLSDQITAEAAARLAADSAEIAVRAAADVILTNDITAEALERTAADYEILNTVEIDINFLFIADYIYNVPKKMKFTQQISEGTAATLSIALDTEMVVYTKLTVTPTQLGLIKLEGVLIP